MSLYSKGLRFLKQSITKMASLIDPIDPYDTEWGGLDLLRKLTGGRWSKTRMLEQYEKSLYASACLDKISQKTASLDINLYRINNSRGDTEQVVMHPLIDLLYKPNPFQTKTEFFKIMAINLKACGDAFWYKIRDSRGQVIELWNLRPDYMTIIKDPKLFIAGYDFNAGSSGVRHIAPDDIVHFRMPSPIEQHYGTSPIASAHSRIETEEYMTAYQRDFFLNSARPDAVLVSTETLTDEEREEMRQSFELRHKGKGKNGRVGILEGGIQYQQISITQREMDYIESLKGTRDDIFVAFNTPKSVVAVSDDVNRANAETGMYIFLSENIRPFAEHIFDVINEMLVIPDFGEELFVNFPDPTPENREQTLLVYDNGIKNGWLLINEVRQKENLPPVDGGWDLYLPFNVTSMGGLSDQQKMKLLTEWEHRKDNERRAVRVKMFRGRQTLLQKFIVKEEVKKMLMADYQKDEETKRVKNKKTKDDTRRKGSILKDLELRTRYIKVVNSQIEQRAERFKGEINNFAEKERIAFTDVIKQNIKSKTKSLSQGMKEVIKSFYKDQAVKSAEFHSKFYEEFLRMAGNEAIAMLISHAKDDGFQVSEAIRKAILKRAKQYGLGVTKTTRQRITNVLAQAIGDSEGMAQISDKIAEVYKEFPTWRADLIARTESTAANNEGFIEAYKQSDVATHKEWINAGDDRVRDEHSNEMGVGGEIVPVESPFSNGLMYPQEPNCRCVLGPAFAPEQ